MNIPTINFSGFLIKPAATKGVKDPLLPRVEDYVTSEAKANKKVLVLAPPKGHSISNLNTFVITGNALKKVKKLTIETIQDYINLNDIQLGKPFYANAINTSNYRELYNAINRLTSSWVGLVNKQEIMEEGIYAGPTKISKRLQRSLMDLKKNKFIVVSKNSDDESQIVVTKDAYNHFKEVKALIDTNSKKIVDFDRRNEFHLKDDALYTELLQLVKPIQEDIYKLLYG